MCLLTAPACFAGPAWIHAHGGISDTSSSSECDYAAEVPPEPICPKLGIDPNGYAAWDLLTRPEGCSLRRLTRLFTRRHGPPPGDWYNLIANFPYLEVFVPERGDLRELALQPTGQVYADGKPHVNAIPIDCTRPGPLSNPWVVNASQSVEDVCALYEKWCGAGVGVSPEVIGGIIHPKCDVASAARRREIELDRLASLVARGASLSLRCCRDCERRKRLAAGAACHVSTLAPLIAALAVAKAEMLRAQIVPPSRHTSVYVRAPGTLGVDRNRSKLRAQAVQQRWRQLHVRRACPPLDVTLLEVEPEPTARLAAALLAAAPVGVDAAAELLVAQPMALAGADGPLPVPRLEAPSAFAHRRMERQPDSETLALPPPRTNVAPVAPEEDPPPVDVPDDIVAYSLEEVIPQRDLQRYRQWARRADRSLVLSERGDDRTSRTVRPDDLTLRGVVFTGRVMDLTSFPFKPLQPSRWPDRPPSGDIRIRQWRREFRSHPAFTDRRLRGLISHGNSEVGPLEEVSFFAAPHASAYAHNEEWRKQMAKELANGWGRLGAPQAEGLVTWPQRCQPTSMVERLGAFRLCHDLSWPPAETDPEVESPNDADTFVMVVVMVVMSQLCFAAAIYIAAGLVVKVSKFDLSKAYKRCGQQRAATWRRTCWSANRSQTLDVIAFGQRDGPTAFTCQTHFMVYIMATELDYADACYPSRDGAVAAFMRARLDAARAAGSDNVRRWASLSYLMAMLDDFGLVSVDDLLFRVDGSPVLAPSGEQKRRPGLHLEVCTSTVERLGHRLERGDPLKFAYASDRMLLLGSVIDVVAETLSFDGDGERSKRVRYIVALDLALAEPAVSVQALTSLAFKMLVVCETYPYGRQQLHAIFAALRHNRTAPVVYEREPMVAVSLRFFLVLLRSDAVLAVPLAPRHSFPFADAKHLLVAFADASGLEAPGVQSTHKPGYGCWTVRGRKLFYTHGLYNRAEVDYLSISVLELVASYWGEVIFSRVAPDISHVLSFTDNTGAEWSMRRETPSARLMQIVTSRRSVFLQQRRLFARSLRVSSSANRWADALSRQDVAAVVAEAQALGLTPILIDVPPDLRDLTWLLERA